MTSHSPHITAPEKLAAQLQATSVEMSEAFDTNAIGSYERQSQRQTVVFVSQNLLAS